jgi:uncharacterized membrane protein YsdA (DUF1294 family)
MKKFTISPFKIFAFLGFLLAVGIAVAMAFYLQIKWMICYLVGINLTTFIFYFYDKQASSLGFMRVPEFILHLFTLLGGTPMAFLAQYIFHHKTIKASFRLIFWIIVVVQIILLWQFLPYFWK